MADNSFANQPADISSAKTDAGAENGHGNSTGVDLASLVQRPADTPASVLSTGDRVGSPARAGVQELQYGDPAFDQKLAALNAPSLQINGLPKGVQINSWVDNNGIFFWYNNGHDNRAHHYLPPNLKSITVDGVNQDVDEMKIQASQAYLAEQNGGKPGFAALNGHSNPLEYAQRMSGVSDQALQLEEKMLRQAAASSPNNPYFPIYLADTVVAQAFKPIVNQVVGGNDTIQLNNPVTMAKLDEAMQMLKYAEQVAARQGNLRAPNMDMAPGLFPFALNPYFNNPDMYWNGALYQAYQREVTLSLLRQVMQHAGGLELPPDMSGA